MKITGTKGIIDDSSIMYCDFLEYVVYHADPEAKIEIEVRDKEFSVSVLPSEVSFRKHLLKNILSMHFLLHLKTDFSKSTKLHKRLFFSINLEIV